jgi:DNA processing protein
VADVAYQGTAYVFFSLMESVDVKKFWIALNMVPGVGPVTYRKLLNHFGSPEQVLSASSSDLKAVPGLGNRVINAILQFDWTARIDKEFEAISQHHAHLLCWDDEAYPVQLKTIFDPPPILYAKGHLECLQDILIAIVGSRRATTYGRTVAENLSRELALKGVGVVSGLARGIDSAAHIGALKGNGKTVAVLGCGIDVVYPPDNKRLYADICEHGVLVSEFPMHTKPDRGNFPARNRIISGLSLGTVVVEAGLQSGALITADMALEQGRDVFAVPGNITSPISRGTNRLIKQGANLVERADDILHALSVEISQQISTNQPELPFHTPHGTVHPTPRIPAFTLTADEERIYDLLSEQPLHIDALTIQAQLPSGTVSAMLMMLEMKGAVKQLSGKMFVRA